jgi:DNA-binding transcriptional LysR family regulator
MSFVKEQLILGHLLNFLNAQSVLEDCFGALNFEMLQRVHLRDLHGEDLIAFPIGSYVRHEVEKLLKQHQVECRIKLSTRSTGDIYQFVKHGAGISLIFPFDQFGDSTIPGLTFCELEEEYVMKIAVFRSHFRKSSLAAEHLLTLMTDMIGKALPSNQVE